MEDKRTEEEKKQDLEEHKELWNATPGCDGHVYSNFYGGGGVKCTKCPGWFCY